MAGIRQLVDRQAQWNAEKPEGGGFNYYPREGDRVMFHFMSTGEDDDPFFEVFWAHEIPPAQQGGWPTLIYCPVESGFDTSYKCSYCEQGLKVKKRMMLWLYIYDILHTSVRTGEQFPTIVDGGYTYFQQHVEDVRLWDTSAWRDSPLDDILVMGQQLGNLHNSIMELRVVGQQLQRRFKIYMRPNTPAFDAKTYEAAKGKCRSILDLLNEKLVQVPVVQAPASEPAQAQPSQSPIPAYQGPAPVAPNPQDPQTEQPPAGEYKKLW